MRSTRLGAIFAVILHRLCSKYSIQSTIRSFRITILSLVTTCPTSCSSSRPTTRALYRRLSATGLRSYGSPVTRKKRSFTLRGDICCPGSFASTASRKIRWSWVTPQYDGSRESHTREAGVRNLEREIAKVCRKVARRLAEGKTKSARISQSQLERLVGKPKYLPEDERHDDMVGVVNGLAVTQFGGEVLHIEAAWTEGKAGFTCTGNLSDVMEESAKAARSYARAKAQEFGFQPNLFEKSRVHLHVPAGAVPKDGPSAGTAMGTALMSALTGVKVRGDVAMTGEITLRGKVLPIGGVKEKVLAAHRLGIEKVILPSANESDLDEIPRQVRKKMNFVLVDQMEQVLAEAFRPEDLRGRGMSLAGAAAN